jgi:deoxycytidylate deaminase
MMSSRIRTMLTRLAHENEGCNGRHKMAAGITYKKHLIATGTNSYKTHPLMNGGGFRVNQVFIHAEVDAIKNALKLITQEQLVRCSLHVVRLKRPCSGSKAWVYGLAKPCPGCEHMIKSFGISRVFYSENDKTMVEF